MSSPPPNRPALRKLLFGLLRTDSALDAFCLDYFPDTKRLFAAGLDREAKVNLLLEVETCDAVFQRLQEAHPVPLQQLQAALSLAPNPSWPPESFAIEVRQRSCEPESEFVARMELPREMLFDTPAARLPQPPDAPYASSWYVSRESEERSALNRLRGPCIPVVLQGPNLYGKATLIGHLLSNLRTGDRAARINLGHLDASFFDTLERLLYEIARNLLEQILPEQANELLELTWQRPASEKSRITWLVERHILESGDRVFLALEQVDQLMGRPYQHEFFAFLRGWMENNSEPWTNLRLLITVSTEPTLLESTDHSSFFAMASPICLKPMELPQLQKMADLYGLRATKAAVGQLFGLTSGHPYLSRLACFTAAEREVTLEEMLAEDDLSSGVFAHHMRRLRRYVEMHGLITSVGRLLDDPYYPISTHEYCLLYSQGLLYEEQTGVYRLCSPLYEEYFRTLCQRRRGKGT